MKKAKQIGAIIGVVLLVGMYVATLVFALMKSEFAGTLFQISLISTILIPILLYTYIFIYRQFGRKKDKDKQGDQHKKEASREQR